MKKTIIVAAFLFICISINLNAQVSVIANKSISESNISVTKIANIFSLDITRWDNGNKIIVINQSGDVSTNFYDKIGKSLMNLKKEWMKKQLTGAAKAPETLASDSDVIAKVKSNPGAIGFISSENVTDDVKVVAEFK
jgi:ABC-type phosphate transport system substrate-binding protein